MPMPERNIQGEYRYAYQGQEKDPETGMEAFELRMWDARIGRWLTTDPAGQYSSPYLGMGNNPISRVDPDGGRNIRFDADGNFIGIDHDVWWHNLLFGNRGQYENSEGGWNNFRLGDPDNDYKDIQDKVIDKIQFVSEEQMMEMYKDAGVFSVEAKEDPIEYMKKNGTGFNKFDYAYSKDGIRKHFKNLASSLFIVKVISVGETIERSEVGYNLNNFGNFLIGGSAAHLNIPSIFIRIGGHLNSLDWWGTAVNGYQPQLDSFDDQRAIQEGHNTVHYSDFFK